MSTRIVTVELPDDVAHIFEVRGAMDGLRLPDAIAAMLAKLADDFRQRTGTPHITA